MTELTEITPNVYQFTRLVNQFLLKTGPDELTLIDTGLPGATKTTLNAVASLGHKPADLKHILISHADLDHMGSLAGIKTATGATVYSGAQTKVHVENRTGAPHAPPLISGIMWLLIKLTLKPATVDQVFADGDTLPMGGGIQVLYTPGHTGDHFSFYWPAERVLFAVDLLSTNFGPGLSYSPAFLSWDTDANVTSTKKVLALDPAVVCVGHGEPVYTPSPDVDALR